MKQLFWICLLLGGVVRAQETETVSVYFPFDKYALTAEAEKTLDSFIRHYGKDTFSLTITGHCDALGSHQYNDQLSRRRSFAVHEYLLNHGIPKNAVRMVQGYGKRRPLNQNETEEQRLQNRRVEISWSRTIIPDDDMPPPVVRLDTVKKAEPLQDPRDTVPRLSRSTLDTIPVGRTLVLRNINFYGGRHRFLPMAYASLDELVDIMKERPNLEIELQGHICCRYGYEEDGIDLDTGEFQLSRNRALAVYYYLVEHGINKNRMRYRGFAGKFPLIWPEESESDRTVNRRVEVKILKK